MKSSRTKDFRNLFASLPQHIKETAKKNYEIWREPISFQSRIQGGQGQWKHLVSQSRNWMESLGSYGKKEEKIVWFWIGSHAKYDRILENK